jgi:hypothetical protein
VIAFGATARGDGLRQGQPIRGSRRFAGSPDGNDSSSHPEPRRNGTVRSNETPFRLSPCPNPRADQSQSTCERVSVRRGRSYRERVCASQRPRGNFLPSLRVRLPKRLETPVARRQSRGTCTDSSGTRRNCGFGELVGGRTSSSTPKSRQRVNRAHRPYGPHCAAKVIFRAVLTLRACKAFGGVSTMSWDTVHWLSGEG